MTEAGTQNLILVLREYAVRQSVLPLSDTLYRAADEIERLAAEVKRLKDIVADWDRTAGFRGYDIAPLLR